MFVVLNPIGAAMCFVPLLIAAFALPYLPRTEDSWVFIGVWGAIAFVSDLLYRIFNREEAWLSPRRGGHLFFIPVCILGLLALWWYVQNALTVGYWLPHTTPDPHAFPR